jgi:putative membrane protein
MSSAALESLAGLPYFIAYFGLSLVLLTACLAVYTAITPHAELQLIRQGNAAASAALAGVLIGFAVPLASAVAHSASLLDMLVWAAAVLVAQLLVYAAVRLAVPQIVGRMREGQVASGVFLGSVAAVVGILNAASSMA